MVYRRKDQQTVKPSNFYSHKYKLPSGSLQFPRSNHQVMIYNGPMEGSQMVSLEGDKNSHLGLQTPGFNSSATASPAGCRDFCIYIMP